MDIVERLRQRIALVKFDSDAIALHDAADTIEQLRGQVDFETQCREDTYADLKIQDAEIERLREQCDRMASLAIDNAKDTERAMRLRKILEDVLETSGEQIPYGTVKTIRSALKEKE